MDIQQSVFIYIGALIPWSSFTNSSLSLTPWRLILLAALILILKRLPWVVLLYRQIPALETRNQAIFSGWYDPLAVSLCFPSFLSRNLTDLHSRLLLFDRRRFGPIGVSALYYAMLALHELPEDRAHLREVIVPIVLFMIFASTLAHVRPPSPFLLLLPAVEQVANILLDILRVFLFPLPSSVLEF